MLFFRKYFWICSRILASFDGNGDGNGDGDGDGDGGEAGTGKTTLAPVEDTCTWVGSETSRHSAYISCSPSCLVQ